MISRLMRWLIEPKPAKRKSIRYLRLKNIDGRRGLGVIDIDLYMREAIKKMKNKTRRKPRGIKRYKAYEYEGDPSMSVDRAGEWVEYLDYEKLLAKYNGVFEWVFNNEGQLPYLDTADEIKTSYEGSLK